MDGWTVPGKFYIQRSPPPLSFSLSLRDRTNDRGNGVSSGGKPMQCKAMQGKSMQCLCKAMKGGN